MLSFTAVAADQDVGSSRISAEQSVKVDYPIVYVRVPRPYPKEYAGINHLNQAGLPQTNAPGAELRVLHPDGRDESLVPVEPHESITDPVVSFDGQWVYYAKFHHMAVGQAHMSKLRSRAGSDIYKVHVATRKIVRLTTQQRTPNTGAIAEGEESHPRGVHNLAPCPVPGNRVVFVSDRNGYRGVRAQTQPGLQLFVMDDGENDGERAYDAGANVELIGPMNLGGALHPVVLKDGRVMFSSLETQGLRSNERWGVWAIHPDGTNWSPLTSALGSPPGQAVHFQAQLADESIIVESYYQTGSTDGFGTYWKFPLQRQGEPAFVSADKQFAPRGMVDLTPFATFADVRPNFGPGQRSGRMTRGNVTHPAGAPDNRLLTVWAPPESTDWKNAPQYNAGIYLMQGESPTDDPSKMLLIKNDSKFQELWPRALVPYKRIFGVDEPKRLTHRNDGAKSAHLPAGTPFGLVGTSSLYKRETYPGGVLSEGSVTAVSRKSDDRKQMWRELATSRFSRPGNFGEQGADAGLYENSDIWGVRILLLEPVSDAVYREQRHFVPVSNAEERIRILGEFPVRKFDGDSQPLDPDGNPDTSFLAKLPADVAWTFQTIDHNGMALNTAQTWHQVRPGEVRNNCGGCHAHSQEPTSFELTAAAKPNYKIWDLTKSTPLFTAKANDQSKRKWDAKGETGVQFADAGMKNVEYYRDIKPILQQSCVACHSKESSKPAARLVMDDETPIDRDWRVPWAENVQLRKRDRLPHSYVRLVQYAWAFQARRSPLIWKVYGKRLDGFDNDDVPSPKLDYHDHDNVMEWCHRSGNKRTDVDYTGRAMPPADAVAGTFKTADGRTVKVPPLSDEQKLTLARWVDLGCPIDLDFDASHPDRRGRGWMLDEGRPTLTLTHPQPGLNTQPITRILIGMHDYYTGLDMDSFTVTADFAIDGAEADDNLAKRFKSRADHVWELKLKQPIADLKRGRVVVSVKDREGNLIRIVRAFSVNLER